MDPKKAKTKQDILSFGGSLGDLVAEIICSSLSLSLLRNKKDVTIEEMECEFSCICGRSQELTKN